ncbi:MAG: hypothetical protein COT81_00610 [Candidatus Buchananbacteria bacterium CG10_big_fil_rev_8_21_14_0_10_42_9]|uniref:Rod shape-determining protein MreD n=1 Tax=Candidatus Buchananbacteria bacterium CG10_big_fil_rev_8_21_14_0_10_42_9 TaxID=1974526 RepID=A0A2H0W2A8_9BACT|nr:MAG: hypothetical protein COT81_00610 [Candidatus Buchananbacteria bacterium CG10_big_fil_rev_8_21_14_0_10_42_9]
MWHKIFIIGIIFIIGFLQVSFIQSLPAPWHHVNLMLATITFLAFRRTAWRLWSAALIFGLILDLYSFYLFGVVAASIVFISIINRLLYLNFFTNRALMSFMAMGFLNVVAYSLIIRLISLTQNSYWPPFSTVIVNMFWSTILTEALVIVFFVVQQMHYRRNQIHSHG